MNLLQVLPPELVQSIVQVVGREQLSALRLTCKTLCRHATSHAFRDINIWLQKESIKTLVKIAKKPHLARHVRHISCGMEEFYDVDFDVFSRLIYRNHLPAGLPEITQSQLHDSYQVYKRYTREQNDMQDRYQDVEMLARAFKAFSGLSSVFITDAWPTTFDSFVDPADPRLRILKQESLLLLRMFEPLSELSPRGKHQMETVTKALAEYGTKLTKFGLQLSSQCRGGRDGPLSPFGSGS